MKLREKVLNAKDLHEEIMNVPEWDTDIGLRSLSLARRNQLLNDAKGEDGKVDEQKLFPMLLIEMIFDPETGRQAFAVTDRDALADKSVGVIERIALKCLSVCGLSKTDELEKNFERTEANDSASV